MATPILQNLKELLEVDLTEEIFDEQLILYTNAGLSYLKNNSIPVEVIEDSLSTFEGFENLDDIDSHIVLSWLHFYILQRFDRTLMQGSNGSNATQEWIDTEMTNIIYQLKCKYGGKS